MRPFAYLWPNSIDDALSFPRIRLWKKASDRRNRYYGFRSGRKCVLTRETGSDNGGSPFGLGTGS
jgi:hypothetical protein